MVKNKQTVWSLYRRCVHTDDALVKQTKDSRHFSIYNLHVLKRKLLAPVCIFFLLAEDFSIYKVDRERGQGFEKNYL